MSVSIKRECKRFAVALVLGSFGCGWIPGVAQGQGAGQTPVQREGTENPEPGPDYEKQLGSTWETRTEARTMTLMVPAPRGQISDRNGTALAATRVVYYLAVTFPFLDNPLEADILFYASQRIEAANRELGAAWSLEDEVILTHYANRRWLPLPFSGALTEKQTKAIEPFLDQGLILHPVYERFYPERSTAAHVVGYVGKTRPMPTGPIENGEPYFVEMEGRDGLEVSFDKQLTGQPGKINVLFASDGTKLTEEMVQRPVPGHNVVTTLDADLQKAAEKTLKDHVKRGAFVMVDIHRGDILVLASWPAFNLNDFIPFVTTETFAALQEDPDIPLFGRAFRGLYPPASTFKIPVALAALESGTIYGESYFECPTSLWIGDRFFHNWAKEYEGSMNVVTAIKRSCNTWFYKVGMMTGNRPVTSLAILLGLGRKTGIPLNGEPDGLVPTNEYWVSKYRYPMSQGDLANMAIGQGHLQTSPLQLAQMMAGVAHGESAPRVKLVKQVQTLNEEVVQNFPDDRLAPLNLTGDSYNLVVQGMIKVVSSGTGTAARHSHLEVAGKTGTAQWGDPEEKKYVAWFTGFFPAHYPMYAIAALYEGDPGESLSGGRNAGSIAGDFLESVYSKEDSETILAAAQEKWKDRPGFEIATVEYAEQSASPMASAVPKDPAPEADEPKKNESGVSKFFNLFRRR